MTPELPERFVVLSELGRGAMGVVYLALDREVAIKLVTPTGSHEPQRVARMRREARLLASLNHPNIAVLHDVVDLARDLALDREVAIKLVTPTGSHEPQRVARMRREARLLASLNHPNIAVLHDVVEHDGCVLLVLEYVPGPTLGERLRKDRPARTEVLGWFRQLAEGIEAAHERGIVHRDLKPSNVAITPDGVVKILDFGLAKLARPEAAEDDPMAPSSLPDDLTQDGDVLGTTAYMSPEQLRGENVDRRADLWAFGCMLFEALAGCRAYPGRTRADTIALVLERSPEWSALPDDLEPGLRDLIARCLEKEPRFRLRDIGEAWVRLARPPAAEAAPGRRPRRLATFAGLIPVLVAAAALGIVWTRPPSRSAGSVQGSDPWFTLGLDQPMVLGYTTLLALSPRGDMLAYAASQHAYVRRLSSLRTDSLPVPRGVRGLFFSPDGHSLGFESDDSRLHRISLVNGTLSDMANAPDARGACWGMDDSIVFAPSFNSGLWKGPAGRGRSRPLTTLDPARGEVTHRWPEILPDGRAAIFTIRRRDQLTFDQAELAVVEFRTGRRWTILEGGSCARFLPPDRLVFVRDSMLRVVRFDVRRLRTLGPPIPTGIRVASSAPTGVGHFCLARDGTLAYAPGGDLMRSGERVVWIDRSGRQLDSLDLDVRCENPVPSPDGRKVAFTLVGAQNDVAVADRATGEITRLTFTPDEDAYPIWTPDGKYVTFTSSRSGALNLYMKPADGNGEDRRLTHSELPQSPCDWSPDGRSLYYTEDDPETRSDVWRLTLQDGRCTPVLHTAANEREARVSPDGRWLAYESDESGRAEVYVASLRGTHERWQLSSRGGAGPRWSARPGELFFQDHERGIVVAQVTTSERFRVLRVRRLFQMPYDRLDFSFAPTADVFLARVPDPGLYQVVVATRWGAPAVPTSAGQAPR